MNRSQRQARIQLLEALYDEAYRTHRNATGDLVVVWKHRAEWIQSHLVAERHTTSP